MKCFLAADIGGSKTLINLYSDKGNILESYIDAGAGLGTDSNEDIPHLSDMLKKISRAHSVYSVAINLGGKNVKQIKGLFKRNFPLAEIEIFRESEGTAALELAELYNTEVVLLAGTGTIAIGYDGNDRYITAGGWGSDIGDDGSGFQIGLRALREALIALDSGKPLTNLQKKLTGLKEPITAKSNIAEICEIRDKVRANLGPRDRRSVAAVTKIVTDFAEQNEPDAVAILKDAGTDMAKLVVNTASSLLPYEVKGVTVTGGLVKLLNCWQESFEEYIKNNSGINSFNYIADGVMLGTFKIAEKNFRKVTK